MKKLLLLSAVLLGAVTVSQAGVRFNLGIGIPVPAPVYVQPSTPAYVDPSCAPAYVQPGPTYVEPYCDPAPVVIGPPVFDFRFGRDHRPYWRHFRDRDDFRHHRRW